jgi:hypothetical protein
MTLTLYFNDDCPKCRRPIMHAMIDPHPTDRDLALQKFHCAGCGPIKVKSISLKSGKPPPEITHRMTPR